MPEQILVIVAVLAGAALQQVTGIGFALVAAPFLVLLLGPVDGVLLVNVCGALTAGLILLNVLQEVDWRRYAILAPSALIGITLGAWAVGLVPSAVLDLGIGLLLAAALTTMLVPSASGMRPRRRYAVTAGALSGFMNTAAGLGGPAVTVFAVATRWPLTSFRPTMQAYFLTIGSCAFLVKLLTGAAAVPALPTWLWLAVVTAAVGGLVVGTRLTRVLPEAGARLALIVVSYIGAVATIIRGTAGLIS